MQGKGHKCGICLKTYECRSRECDLPDNTLCSDCFAHESQRLMIQAIREQQTQHSCDCGSGGCVDSGCEVISIEEPKSVSSSKTEVRSKDAGIYS